MTLGMSSFPKSRSRTGTVPEPVPNRTEVKNIGGFLVLKIHEIRESVPSILVLVLKTGTIPGTGTGDVNSV